MILSSAIGLGSGDKPLTIADHLGQSDLKALASEATLVLGDVQSRRSRDA
jgi:hypothetical protein